MHQRITHSGVGRAYPLFGLNAKTQYGVLTLTAKCDNTDASVYLAVLPYAPPGTPDADQSIATADPVGSPTVALTLVSEGGLCLDGIDLRDMAYVYVGQHTDASNPFQIDISFTPVVTMVIGVK